MAAFLTKVYLVDEEVERHQILSAVLSASFLVALWPLSALIFFAIVVTDIRNKND